jgi:hypothetical protein
MADKKVVSVQEEILFELMVLASEAPKEDRLISIATIAALTQFTPEVTGYFIETAQQIFAKEGYDAMMKVYSELLFANHKEELALDLNELSIKLS